MTLDQTSSSTRSGSPSRLALDERTHARDRRRRRSRCDRRRARSRRASRRRRSSGAAARSRRRAPIARACSSSTGWSDDGQPARRVTASACGADRELDDLRELAGARAEQARDAIGAQVGELAREQERELVVARRALSSDAAAESRARARACRRAVRIAILHGAGCSRSRYTGGRGDAERAERRARARLRDVRGDLVLLATARRAAAACARARRRTAARRPRTAPRAGGRRRSARARASRRS